MKLICAVLPLLLGGDECEKWYFQQEYQGKLFDEKGRSLNS